MKIKLIFILLITVTNLWAQKVDFIEDIGCEIHLDEKYGHYPRNTFDIILPNSEKPTGLVIYIHGGGFIKGDKRNGLNRKEDILYFLNNNIAFATINYRFYKNNDSLGVKTCLNDIQRAIQFIRFNSNKYNIEKSLIACYGGSAGAGASLYFAFHDEMAIKNDTTLLGESTRIKCAGAIDTQATYNLFRWKRFIPRLGLATLFKRKLFYKSAANFYGYLSYKDLKKHKKEITKCLDMLEMIDPNDPPIYLMNLMKETRLKHMGIIQHHKKHALTVSKFLKQNDIEHNIYTYNKEMQKENDIDYKIRDFLVKHLKQKTD